MTANQPIPKVVKLDPEIKNRLERLGQTKHRSSHYLMKEAIVRYLDQEEYNEKINQETLARWNEAETGRTVSDDAVNQWLDTWGSDHENEKPTCGK